MGVEGKRTIPTEVHLLLISALFACDGSGDAECDVGTLTVNITLPSEASGLSPVIDIYTLDGEFVGHPTDAPLTDVAAGDYVLIARSVRGADDGSGFSTAWGLMENGVQTITVCGDTTIELAYETLPGSRHLWATQGEAIAGYTPEDLASGSAAPDLQLDIPVTNDLRGLAFDAVGNAWVATSDTYGVRLLVFSPAQLLSGGDPILTLTNSYFDDHASISEIAFGSKDSLEVSVRSSYSGFEGFLGYVGWPMYAAILEGGTVALEPANAHAAATGVAIADMAFDAAGDLWATGEGAGVVYRLGGGGLVGTEEIGSDEQITVHEDEVELRGPTDLAFMPDGSLVVDFWTDGQFVRISTDDLALTDSVEVTPVEVWEQDVLSLPSGLAITGIGDAWTADGDGFRTLAGDRFVPESALVPASDLVVN